MNLYQHDSPSQFRFEVKGELSGPCVSELRNAWMTVGASYQGRNIALEVAELQGADDAGMILLREMQAAGVALGVSRTPLDPALLRTLGVDFDRQQKPGRSCWSWPKLLDWTS